MYKTDCISYDKDNVRYVDYSGKALAVYNIKNNNAEFFQKMQICYMKLFICLYIQE